MAQQVLNVQALVGQNRNQVHGQVSGDLVPQRLYNLAPHRAGGYAPFGRRAPMNSVGITGNEEIFVYYDTSGSISSGDLTSLRSAIDGVVDELISLGVPAGNIHETNNTSERYLQWFVQNSDDYIVIAIINESSNIYHGTSDSGPTSSWTTDYNALVSHLSGDVRFRAYIYALDPITDSGGSNNVDTFNDEHLPRAVNGTNGYPDDPSLYYLGVRYEVGVAVNQPSSAYLADIQSFMAGGDGSQVRLAHIANLIGQDETGIASFATSRPEQSGRLELFRGVHVHKQSGSPYASPSDAVHLENAGAYMSRDAFLVLDQVNRPVEPIRASITTVPDVGSPINEHDVGVAEGIRFADVEFGDGIFIAVTDVGVVYRSEDRGFTWTETDDLSGVATSIAYGGGFWVIGRNDGTIYRTSDPEAGWTAVTVGGFGQTGPVSWGGGSTFYIMRANQVHRSTDGGQSWAVVDTLQDLGAFGDNEFYGPGRIAYHEASSMYATVASDTINVGSPEWEALSSENGENFFFAGSAGGRWEGQFGWTEAGSDRFYALHPDSGRVLRSSQLPASSETHRWDTAATLSGYPAKIKYNATKDMLVVVGGTSNSLSSAARVWQGGTVSALSRMTEIEDAFAARGTSYVSSVAFDDEGGAVYVGNNGLIITTSVSPGLKSGTYNVFYVSYFNTKAGRFVFDFRQETHSFNEAFGNSLKIRAQGKGSILTDNDWLAGRNDAQEILDSLRFDVYIQHTPEVGDTEEDDLSFAEQTAEYTIRYAFTEPFPDGNNAVVLQNRTIDALPLGRQIVANGVPTTAVFEKSRTLNRDGDTTPIQSRTALHNGRVWGLAAQDEDRWHDEDKISPEIANQFNRFVLTYTETGWANLISDQNYVPIQPTQSQFFTGMLSTPSGLMLMFENEIFLVDGDPAFGNLSVQLYLDMAGCDVGAMPCKIGGLPFTVWDGKVWLLQAGQAQEVSAGQWLPDDPFIRIAPEPQTRSLMALTEKGRVLRYLVDQGFWLTDVVTRDDTEIAEMFPNCTCITGHNTRFADDSGRLWATVLDGTPDTPHIVYRDVDFGVPERRTPLYIAKLTLEGPLVGAQYDRDEPDYDAEQIPALFYEAGSSSNGNTHQTVAEQTGGIRPYCGDPGERRVNTLSFRPPLRVTRSYTLNLRFELRGMDYTDVVRPPVRLHHAVGGETR